MTKSLFRAEWKDLPVAGVVSEEPELAKNDGQEDRVEHLDPELVKEDDDGDANAEGREGAGDFDGVVEILAFQQALFRHLATKLQVLPVVLVAYGLFHRSFKVFPVGSEADVP